MEKQARVMVHKAKWLSRKISSTTIKYHLKRSIWRSLAYILPDTTLYLQQWKNPPNLYIVRQYLHWGNLELTIDPEILDPSLFLARSVTPIKRTGNWSHKSLNSTCGFQHHSRPLPMDPTWEIPAGSLCVKTPINTPILWIKYSYNGHLD